VPTIFSYHWRWINHIGPLRVSNEDECNGLNISEPHVKNELVELLYAIEAETKVRDLKRRLRVEPFTEIGQIAQQYNQLIGTFNKW